MKNMTVLVREVHIAKHDVEVADDATSEDAIMAVREGKGVLQDNGVEYSHNLEPDTWTVWG